MATRPSPTTPGPVAPQHYTPPTARELRAQNVQRLQVGLFGLAAMLLLVGLANIIMDRARLAEAVSGPPSPSASVSADTEAKSDPLADAGVVPSASASARPAASAAAPVNH